MAETPPGDQTGDIGVHLRFQSHLLASPAAVWDEVTTMRGVNHELLPFVRMTTPPDVVRLDEDTAREHAGFKSWVLLLGVLPIDRHTFGFDGVDDGKAFRERSHSWQNREWHHARTVSPGPQEGTTTVVDELDFEPRVGLMTPVVRRFVATLFRHRHHQLRRRFGEA